MPYENISAEYNQAISQDFESSFRTKRIDLNHSSGP